MKAKTRIRVNRQGRVVIPSTFRKEMGIRAGDELVCEIEDGDLRLSTVKRNIERAQRLVRKFVKPSRSLADELIAERHATARDD